MMGFAYTQLKKAGLHKISPIKESKSAQSPRRLEISHIEGRCPAML